MSRRNPLFIVAFSCLLAAWCAIFAGSASAQMLTPLDPTQPTPLQHLNSDMDGNGFHLGHPEMPSAPSRPTNWAGGTRADTVSGPGNALGDGLGFSPDEAQSYARQLHEQAQRANRLGGPPAVPAPLYGSNLQRVLASPYKLANVRTAGEPMVTDARPQTPTPTQQEPFVYEAEQVAYQAPYAAPQATASPPPAYAPGGAGYVQHPVSPATPPGGPAPHSVAVGPPADPGELVLEDPSMVIGRVDQQVILLSDVLLAVNEELEKYAGQIPPEQVPEVRRMFIEMALRPVIEAKMVTADLKRKLPEEVHKRVAQKLSEHWEENEYPQQLRVAKVESRRELEAEYRRVGTTLEREKQHWMETELARQWMGQQINFDEEVTHEQMLKRYQADIAKYEFPAGVRWEEIKLHYTPQTRAEAWRRLAEAGNQILAGAPFGEVAKSISEGTSAATGGARDWTERGSLTSQVLDDALFSLPIEKPSPIIDTGHALYIVRVVERREAGALPFTEAQGQIKETIKSERIAQQSKSYMEKMYAQRRIWTIFDAKNGAANPADQAGPRTAANRSR